MFRGPGNGLVDSGFHGFRMKPHFIVGDHTGNFQKPNPFPNFLNEDGLAGILLAKRNLAARSYDFNRLASWHPLTSILIIVLHDIMIA
jgi:hypothetical protein